jgi:hypothetical protein
MGFYFRRCPRASRGPPRDPSRPAKPFRTSRPQVGCTGGTLRLHPKESRRLNSGGTRPAQLPRNPANSTRRDPAGQPEGSRGCQAEASNLRLSCGRAQQPEAATRSPANLRLPCGRAQQPEAVMRSPANLRLPCGRAQQPEAVMRGDQKQRAAPLAGAPPRKPRQTWLPSVHLLRQSGRLTWPDTPPAAGRAWVPGCRARTLKRPYPSSTTKCSA